MSLTGDFPKLRTLGAQLGSSPKILREGTRGLGDAAMDEYQAGFSSKSDPWGSGWEATPSNGDVNYRTGALANPTITAIGGRVRMRLEKYWVFRQIGAQDSPQHAVVPFAEGSRWDAPFERVLNDQVEKHFGV